MPQVLPMTRVEAYLAYKAGVIQESELKPTLKTNFYTGLEHWLAFWCGLCEDYPVDENNDPKWYNEEEYYIAYLCGIAPDYPVNCYRRVGAYLRHIISYRWPEPEKPLTREEYYLSLINSTTTSNPTPSSDFTLNDTTDGAFQAVEVYGDTFQQTYTGKNLWSAKKLVNGYYAFANGNLDQSGTKYVTSTAKIPVTAGETYCISADKGTGVAGTGCVFFNGNTFVSSAVYPAGQTFTVPAGCDYMVYNFYNATSLAPDEVTHIQLEKGDSPTSYEPYVGGIPAPNPDYPQDINVVTGNQTVLVIGKNFIDATKGANSSNYTVSLGTIEGRNDLNGLPIYLKPNTAYTVSLDANGWAMNNGWLLWLTSATQRLAILQYRGNPSQGIPGAITDPVTFTTDDSGIVYLAEVFGGSPGRLDTYFATVKLQLEIGNQATAYRPYASQNYAIDLGSLELCKIGDYQDYIRKSTGKNLMNPIPATSNTRGTTTTVSSGGTVTVTGTTTANYPWILDAPVSFPAGTYTFSSEVPLSIRLYTDSTNYINVGISNKTRTQDIPSPVVRVLVLKDTGSGVSVNFTFNLQIERGSTPTDYEPYGEVWYKHAEVSKALFKDMGFYAAQIGVTGHYRMWSDALMNEVVPSSSTEVTAAKTNVYVARTQSETYALAMGFDINSSGRVQVYDGDYDSSSATDFIADMTAKNAVIYYPLATSINEEITDAALVAQLDALAAGQSYDPLTNFIVTATDPNLPALLKITAYKKQ